MDVSEAIARVNGAAQPPGWRIVAEDARPRHHDMLRLRITIAAANSDRENAPQYGEMVKGGAKSAFYVPVGDVENVAQLFALVVDRMTEAFRHEAREFLRTWDGRRWFAPLHPHHASGIAAWSRHAGSPADADLMFGAA